MGNDSEFAAAKINLCLHVTGQRTDGYHLLDSLVAFAGVGDRLNGQPAGVSSLTLEGPFGARLPVDGDNLVMRAARAMVPDFPAAFRLVKNLPPASGIGGGSADAAAAIRLILKLRDPGHAATVGANLLAGQDKGALQALGADVPVCFLSRPARMRGIGERLDLITGLPSGWILLVNPGVEVPTPAVFRALTRKDNPPLPENLPDWPDFPSLATWLSGQRNDLEAPARQIAPVINTVLETLQRQPGQLLARMSGSGATCFALFADEAAASTAAAAISAAEPAWWVAAAPLLGSGRQGDASGQAMRETT